MPYDLVRVSPNGYFVETKETGRRHSKQPLPYDQAIKQMRALYAAEAAEDSAMPRSRNATGKRWIQEVVNDPSFQHGAFTRQALEHKMTTQQFKEEVLRHPEKYDLKTRRRAQFMHNIGV